MYSVSRTSILAPGSIESILFRSSLNVLPLGFGPPLVHERLPIPLIFDERLGLRDLAGLACDPRYDLLDDIVDREARYELLVPDNLVAQKASL